MPSVKRQNNTGRESGATPHGQNWRILTMTVLVTQFMPSIAALFNGSMFNDSIQPSSAAHKKSFKPCIPHNVSRR
jgi:hypothetical protein